MNRLPEWLTDALIVVLILCLFIIKCGTGTNDNGNTTSDTVVVYDTIHHIDTVAVDKIKSVTSYYAKHDTTWIVNFDTVKIAESDCDSVRDYSNYNRDSSVIVKSTVHGIMLGQIIDSRIINKAITITNTEYPSFTMYGQVGVSTVSITAGIVIARKRDMFGVSEVFYEGKAVPQIHYGIKLFGQ